MCPTTMTQVGHERVIIERWNRLYYTARGKGHVCKKHYYKQSPKLLNHHLLERLSIMFYYSYNFDGKVTSVQEPNLLELCF